MLQHAEQERIAENLAETWTRDLEQGQVPYSGVQYSYEGVVLDMVEVNSCTFVRPQGCLVCVAISRLAPKFKERSI